MKKISFLVVALIFPILLNAESTYVANKTYTVDKAEESYYADYLELNRLVGTEELQKVMLHNLFAMNKPSSGVESEIMKNVETIVNEELSKLNHKLFPVYKKYQSHADLKQLIVFYKSPLGKRMVKTLPLIIKESMPISAAWGQDVAKRLNFLK